MIGSFIYRNGLAPGNLIAIKGTKIKYLQIKIRHLNSLYLTLGQYPTFCLQLDKRYLMANTIRHVYVDSWDSYSWERRPFVDTALNWACFLFLLIFWLLYYSLASWLSVWSPNSCWATYCVVTKICFNSSFGLRCFST